MLVQRNLTFDCHSPKALAHFWADALGVEVSGGEDEAFAAPPAWEPDGSWGPRLMFQRVPEDKVMKNRLHLDLTAGDMEVEVARLTGMGARRERLVEQEGLRWTVMTDPEGNEFCVLQSPD